MELFEVIKWWLVLEVIGLGALPLTAWIFQNLDDRGISLSKIAGLLLVTYFSWALSSFGLPYSSMVVGISLLMLFSLSLIVYYFRGFSFNKKEFIITELIFTAAYLVFVVFRAFSPEIYWTGGEKFMDMSFINIILRSSSFPPMDPWLSGETMQYYYFGYLLIADLIKLSNVPPAIGFNLGVASMFALSASAAYGLGKALTRSRGFGIITMAFVVIFGNPTGFIQLIVILFIPKYYYIFRGAEGDLIQRLSTYNYWPSSRIIPKTINEFPYFSFIHADLHAHMISIAFQLLAIALLFNLLLQKRENNITSLGAIALVLGFLFPLNSWDYPTYVIFFIIVLIVWRILPMVKGDNVNLVVDKIRHFDPRKTAGAVFFCSLVIILSYLTYLPYHTASRVPHAIKPVTYGQSQLIFYLGVYFIMLFFIMIYTIISFNEAYHPDIKFIMAGLAISVLAAYFAHIQILIIILPLFVMSTAILIKEEDPLRQFVNILILMGALLSLFCELFYIQDAFGISSPEYIRLNTVFKIYMQNWIIWGLAAGVCFNHLWHRWVASANLNRGFALMSIFLVMAAMTYPVFATYSRSGNFKGQPTLDGAAYMEKQYPNEYNAILWLNRLNGTPIVLQSPGNSYQLNTHVTAFTGLPTVIGWGGHEMNWRNNDKIINQRWSEVPEVYNSKDNKTVFKILDKYNVDYIYVGGVEYERYGGNAAVRFFQSNEDRFELVYSNPNVYIYKVVRPDE